MVIFHSYVSLPEGIIDTYEQVLVLDETNSYTYLMKPIVIHTSTYLMKTVMDKSLTKPVIILLIAITIP